jgi:hypothetical protein
MHGLVFPADRFGRVFFNGRTALPFLHKPLYQFRYGSHHGRIGARLGSEAFDLDPENDYVRRRDAEGLRKAEGLGWPQVMGRSRPQGFDRGVRPNETVNRARPCACDESIDQEERAAPVQPVEETLATLNHVNFDVRGQSLPLP